MKKRFVSRSAFFNPRVIGLAFCAIGLLLALVAFALYPGGNALAARQNQSASPAVQAVPLEIAQSSIPTVKGILSQETSVAPEAVATDLPVSGHIDMAAMGIRPLPFPLAPDSAAMGTGSAFMQTSSDIVNQSVTPSAFAALSTGWTPGEMVAFSLNGGAATNFTSGSFGSGVPIGYLGITISTGTGFGYITIDALGLTSGRHTGAVVQVAPTGPYLPGVAVAPHAENTSGTSPTILLFGTGYPASTAITRYRNGVSTGTTTTGTAGTFFSALTITNNGNTSAVYSYDNAVAGNMNGSSVEERTDAGGPQAGDLNTSWAFVDRPVLNSATGGTFAVVGEGFKIGETVNLTGCATAALTADANGAASAFVTAPAGAGVYACVMTGAASARVARASVLANADASNRRSVIVAPSGGSPGGTVTVLGTKLPASDTGNIYLDGVLQGSATTNASGFASFTMTKPTTGFVHAVAWITASGAGDAVATTFLLGAPAASPTPTVAGTPSPTPTATATATSTATIPPTPTPTPSPGCGVVLYDQTDMPGTGGTSSQNFETVNDAYDDEAADDFFVPAGATWTIQQITVKGSYSTTGPVSTFNVRFYQDSGTYPGFNMFYTGGLNATYVQAGTDFVITLPTPIVLTNGFYWVSVQANMDFTPGGQWYWTNRVATSNNGAAWQDPGSGFGAACPTWGRRSTVCIPTSSGEPDQLFKLIGCPVAMTPTPTPTPSGTITPTPSPTPTATATATIPPTPTPTPAATCPAAEGFDVVANLGLNGWTQTNNSTVVGTTGWFQGSTSVFTSQTGAVDSYIGANYNNDGGPATDTISNWLLTPPLTLSNGAVFSFWTRTVDTPAFPDRLQVRMSTNGNSSNVGVTATDVGDFGTLLLDINPTYLLTGVGSYPNVWTQFNVTLSGLGGPTAGRIAFRYFVENGGPSGANSDYIGIDTMTYTCPAAPTPTPTPVISISGKLTYCANPAANGVPGVTMNLSGTSSGSTTTDALGNYSFPSIPAGTYTVTAGLPTPTPRAPTSAGITGLDAVAAQRHFLVLGTPLTGCRKAAADVNFPPNGIGTTDPVAIQRFFLGFVTGIAQTGQYKFTTDGGTTLFTSATRTGITATTTTADFGVVILGDCQSGYIFRPEGGPAQEGAENEIASTVAAVVLPEVTLNQSKSSLTAAVTTTAIDGKSKLVGFQGDFTFDERVVSFASEPVQKAGMTAGNWNVAGNVLDGPGPIRTLRVSAYSNDFAPLNGSGTLFELKMTRVNKGGQSTQLVWAAAPNQFLFIDADLNTQNAGNAAPGSVTVRPSQR